MSEKKDQLKEILKDQLNKEAKQMTWVRAANQYRVITEEIILKCSEYNTHEQ